MSVEETKTMTMYEFGLYGLAYQIKKQDKRQDASYQSWQNQNVQATKGKGNNVRSAFRSFNDFYDAGRDFESIMTGSSPQKRPVTIAELKKRQNENRGEMNGTNI